MSHSPILAGILLVCGTAAYSQNAAEGRPCIPETTDMVIGVDDINLCAIDTRGDTDTFRFSAQEGERVSIQVTRHSGGEPEIELFNPAGARVAGPVNSGPFSQFARIDFQLTSTGTHTIRVSDWGNDAGQMDYVLVLTRVSSPAPTFLHPGSRLIGDISPRGDVDFYSFSGSANELMLIQLTRHSGGEPEIEILDASGARVAGPVNSGPFSQFARMDFRLPATGNYTIRVSDWGSDAGILTYFLSLNRVGAPSPEFVRIEFGRGYTGDLTPRGDSEFYVFSGTAGATVTIQSTRQSGGEPELELFNEAGTRVAGPVNSGPFSQFARMDVTLPATGTFSIRASDWGSDSPAAYRLEVQCIGACPSPPPQLTRGRFVPVTPCRIADTRLPGGPFGGSILSGDETRVFRIADSGCQIPLNAVAYALNVTVVPAGPLAFLSIWPSGQPRPLVSTLNSFEGAVVANGAVVPAGNSGAINVYASHQTHVILDINGYFADPTSAPQSLAFYPLVPCRIADTRNAAGTFGGPVIAGGQAREFPVRSSGCGLPATAQAYSLNITAIPAGPLSFLTAWPAGSPRPFVSTLNSFRGTVVANAAIVPAGANGGVSVFVTDPADVVIDISGYFGPPGSGGLQFNTLPPCRVMDTRNVAGPFGGPAMDAGTIREVNPTQSSCSPPTSAQAYSTNVTVVPTGPLAFLSLWPAGQPQPAVSTLNSFLGAVVANAAIVPAGTAGAANIFVTNRTDVILDINGYFAP